MLPNNNNNQQCLPLLLLHPQFLLPCHRGLLPLLIALPPVDSTTKEHRHARVCEGNEDALCVALFLVHRASRLLVECRERG